MISSAKLSSFVEHTYLWRQADPVKVFTDVRKVLAHVFLRSRLGSIDWWVVERFANEFHNLSEEKAKKKG